MAKSIKVRVRWQEYAACREEDPELFFPTGETGPAVAQIEQAKAVCRRCPAIGHCLLFAIEGGITDGVWGGTSETERRALTRRLKVSPVSFAQEVHDTAQAAAEQNGYYEAHGLEPLQPVMRRIYPEEQSGTEMPQKNFRA